jgi:hypothetical protein
LAGFSLFGHTWTSRQKFFSNMCREARALHTFLVLDVW